MLSNKKKSTFRVLWQAVFVLVLGFAVLPSGNAFSASDGFEMKCECRGQVEWCNHPNGQWYQVNNEGTPNKCAGNTTTSPAAGAQGDKPAQGTPGNEPYFDASARCNGGEGWCRTDGANCPAGFKTITGSANTCKKVAGGQIDCCILDKSASKNESSQTGGVNPADFIPQGTGLSTATPQEVLMKVLNWLLLIFGSLAILAFLFAGVQYLLAFGDDKQVETAKKNVKLSMIGIAIAFSAMILITAIAGLLGAE